MCGVFKSLGNQHRLTVSAHLVTQRSVSVAVSKSGQGPNCVAYGITLEKLSAKRTALYRVMSLLS